MMRMKRKIKGVLSGFFAMLGGVLCGVVLFWLFQVDNRTVQATGTGVDSDEKKPSSAVVAPPVNRSDSSESALHQAKEALAAGEWLRAREELEAILSRGADFSQSDEARRLWREAVWAMIMTNRSSLESVVYTVANGDTLGKIAREKGTTVELIRRRNNLKGDHIRVGQKLSIFVKPLTLHVDKKANRLLVKMDGNTIKIYPVSTGKATTTTPEGEFFIRDRLPHPTWFHNGTVVPPDSPENELGTRWLGFDKPKYGIHGTIHPEQIGRSVSSGCVRMLNEDVEELFDVIPIGTKVFITDASPSPSNP
jgi:lipoprotein-anchoring transpeptidase ErfK/SrfK